MIEVRDLAKHFGSIEAVRQVRGESPSQVPDAALSMVISGPMVTPVSSLILGGEAAL